MGSLFPPLEPVSQLNNSGLGTFLIVEAALLNSEGNPEEEIKAALAATIRFAHCELSATKEQLRKCFEHILTEELIDEV